MPGVDERSSHFAALLIHVPKLIFHALGSRFVNLAKHSWLTPQGKTEEIQAGGKNERRETDTQQPMVAPIPFRQQSTHGTNVFTAQSLQVVLMLQIDFSDFFQLQ